LKQKKDKYYIEREMKILAIKERYRNATFSPVTNKELAKEAIQNIYKKYPL
jgi:hypothetical protein